MQIRVTNFLTSEIPRRETLFHVANGYLGMRGSFEEGVPENVRSVRGTYINGFFDSAPIHYEEKLHGFASTQQSIANIIDVQGISITLGGEAFSCFTGALESFEQLMDTQTGIYTRTVTWLSPEGRRTHLVFQRLASFSIPQLIAMQVSITALNWSGEVQFTSTQRGDVSQDFDPKDPRKASTGRKMIRVTRSKAAEETLWMEADTIHSGLQLVSAVRHTWQEALTQTTSSQGELNSALISGHIEEGHSLRLTKHCIFTDSRRFSYPAQAAKELLAQAGRFSFDQIAARQKAILDSFWANAGAGILGQEDLNASLAYSIYTLFASAGKDGIGNIASKGLSGEGYEGHYFWDTEIYMFPLFLLTQPDIAKKLLESRVAMLPEAFAHARDMGHQKGALYAWRTITGSECSAYYPSGSAQYHINGAIAHAFLTYWQATGDLAFMQQAGARVLIETARLWMDAGHWQNGQFRIDSVTGPDEYSCIVNNNYYTNRSAQSHLRGVYALIARLQEQHMLEEVIQQSGISLDEAESFKKAADAMYLPFDEALGISAQDDAFLSKKRMEIGSLPREDFPLLLHYHPLFLYRHQVCKQADTVLAHFLYEEGESEEVIKATYDYYEGITTHDSSLSESVFSMMAARTGQVEKAYHYYQRSAVIDLKDTHGNTADGIHAANMGGCFMGVAFGFGGLRLHSKGLILRPCLPRELSGYWFTVLWQGTRIKVEVDPRQVLLTILEGKGLNLQVYNRQYHVKDSLALPLNG